MFRELYREYISVSDEPITLREILIGVAGALGVYAAIWGLFILDLAIRG